MFSRFVTNNIPLVSIILFIIFFILMLIIKPTLIFDKNGRPREFGIGYKNKTICPIWLIIIVFGIISYLAVLYYVNFRKYIF